MVPGKRNDFDGFAAQRVRHIDVAAISDGDAVAVMADMVDDEALGKDMAVEAGKLA